MELLYDGRIVQSMLISYNDGKPTGWINKARVHKGTGLVVDGKSYKFENYARYLHKNKSFLTYMCSWNVDEHSNCLYYHKARSIDKDMRSIISMRSVPESVTEGIYISVTDVCDYFIVGLNLNSMSLIDLYVKWWGRRRKSYLKVIDTKEFVEITVNDLSRLDAIIAKHQFSVGTDSFYGEAHIF